MAKKRKSAERLGLQAIELSFFAFFSKSASICTIVTLKTEESGQGAESMFGRGFLTPTPPLTDCLRPEKLAIESIV